MPERTLKYDSIFNSISGELGGFRQGEFVTFLRLNGCNLRCSYCDAQNTWDANKGTVATASQLASLLRGFKKILITGGEPLTQQFGLLQTLRTLRHFNQNVLFQIETNGTILPCADLFALINYWVFDFKFGERNIFTTDPNNARDMLDVAPQQVFIKFVAQTEAQLHEAVSAIGYFKNRYSAYPIVYAISPVVGYGFDHHFVYQFIQKELGPTTDVIFNTQLHKLIDPRGSLIL